MATTDKHKRAMESMDIRGFAQYQLDNIKLSRHQTNNYSTITATDYFLKLLSEIQRETLNIRASKKLVIYVDDLVTLGPNY